MTGLTGGAVGGAGSSSAAFQNPGVVSTGMNTNAFDATGAFYSNAMTHGTAEREMRVLDQQQGHQLQDQQSALNEWKTKFAAQENASIAQQTMGGHLAQQKGILQTTNVVDSAGATLAKKLEDVDPEDTETINAIMGNIRALPQANSMGMQNMTTMFGQGHGQVQSSLGGTTNMNGAEMMGATAGNPLAQTAAVSPGGMGMGMGMMGMPMMDPTMGGMFGGMGAGAPAVGVAGAAPGATGGTSAGGFG